MIVFFALSLPKYFAANLIWSVFQYRQGFCWGTFLLSSVCHEAFQMGTDLGFTCIEGVASRDNIFYEAECL